MILPPCWSYSTKAGAPNQAGNLQVIAYFSRSPDIGRMKPHAETSDEAQGLRLVRAFLLLPPDKRAEVLAFVEDLLRAHPRSEEGQEVSPT
jgi:hypothetical protein